MVSTQEHGLRLVSYGFYLWSGALQCNTRDTAYASIEIYRVEHVGVYTTCVRCYTITRWCTSTYSGYVGDVQSDVVANLGYWHVAGYNIRHRGIRRYRQGEQKPAGRGARVLTR